MEGKILPIRRMVGEALYVDPKIHEKVNVFSNAARAFLQAHWVRLSQGQEVAHGGIYERIGTGQYCPRTHQKASFQGQ